MYWFVCRFCNELGLADNHYFDDPAFINYLKYLQYCKKPEYAKYIVYALYSVFLDVGILSVSISLISFKTSLFVL